MAGELDGGVWPVEDAITSGGGVWPLEEAPGKRMRSVPSGGVVSGR